MGDRLTEFLNAKLPEGVNLMQIDPANVDWLWTNITKFDSLFSDYAKRDQMAFLQRLCDKDTLCFRIGDTGYVFLEEIVPGKECRFHGASFDRVLKGKESIAISIIRMMFDLFRFERMNASVPDYARFAMGFLKRIGFTKEGTKRRAFKYKGEWHDLIDWGILRTEI